ncbi:MAG: hypothetical protein LBT40_05960 [Deltaproteobacteria bacterium]|nr:hypothetical protein [Deltaproteobacteria bacterium]
MRETENGAILPCRADDCPADVSPANSTQARVLDVAGCPGTALSAPGRPWPASFAPAFPRTGLSAPVRPRLSAPARPRSLAIALPRTAALSLIAHACAFAFVLAFSMLPARTALAQDVPHDSLGPPPAAAAPDGSAPARPAGTVPPMFAVAPSAQQAGSGSSEAATAGLPASPAAASPSGTADVGRAGASGPGPGAGAPGAAGSASEAAAGSGSGAAPAAAPSGAAPARGQSPDVVWMRTYGGPGEDSFARVSATSDGGLVAAGRSSSSEGDVEGNRGASDAWLVRLDGDGEVLWARSLGGSDQDFATSIVQASDGGFYAAGGTRSTDGDFREATGGLSAWAARLRADGSVRWIKVFGGEVEWEARALLEAPGGGLVVMGEVDSPEDGCPEGGGPCGNIMVARLDPTGDTLRVRRPRARATLPGNAAAGVPGGGAVAAFEMYASDGSPEARVIRTGPQGRHLWTRTVATDAACYGVASAPGESFAGAGQASRAPDGGQAQRSPWLFLLGPDGNLLWEIVPDIGMEGEFHGVSAAGGLILAAGAAENPGRGEAGAYDVLVAAAEPGGDVLWTMILGGGGLDWGASVEALPGGGLAVGGSTASSDGDMLAAGREPSRVDADGLIVRLAPARPAPSEPGPPDGAGPGADRQ